MCKSWNICTRENIFSNHLYFLTTLTEYFPLTHEYNHGKLYHDLIVYAKFLGVKSTPVVCACAASFLICLIKQNLHDIQLVFISNIICYFLIISRRNETVIFISLKRDIKWKLWLLTTEKLSSDYAEWVFQKISQSFFIYIVFSYITEEH